MIDTPQWGRMLVPAQQSKGQTKEEKKRKEKNNKSCFSNQEQ